MASNTVKNKLGEEEMLEKLIAPQAGPIEHKILYHVVLMYVYWHLAAIYGLYLVFTESTWTTLVFSYLVYLAAQIGSMGGAHRLWSHKSFKAKLPLQVILMIFHSFSLQTTVFVWVRDHRLHHMFCDTDADPYNAARGFFFSHFGWVLVEQNPEVAKRSKMIDLSDIYNNPVLMFQKRCGYVFLFSLCFVVPTVIPVYFWGETFSVAYHINILRFVLNLNATSLINSAAHKWGSKPYDKNILPAQNVTVSIVSCGEGFHNYHHVFPWDYKAAELGNNKLNLTTKFIDFFAWIGWAYDLKTVPEDVVRRRAQRTGDGTNSWGWGDKNVSEDDRNDTDVHPM